LSAAPTERPPLARRVGYFAIFGLIAAAIVGATVFLVYGDIVNRLAVSRHDSRPVLEGVNIAPFVSMPDPGVFPVGLAEAPDGTLYLSLFGTGAIKRIAADGSLATIHQLTAPGAIAFGPDGSLYVIDYRAADFRTSGQLNRIRPDGQVTLVGEALNTQGLPLLAQLAIDSTGNVYVSNPERGQVWRVTPGGQAASWWTIAPIGDVRAQPIGLAYDAARESLLVADAGTGTLYRVSLNADIPTGEPLYRLAGVDFRAVALDDQGRPLLAIWAHDNGLLSRLEPDGTLVTLAEAFRAPTAILFEDGRALVVNSDLPGLIEQVGAEPPFTVDVVTFDGTP
jgi:sugar lactone lactonase YvrE